MTVETTNIKEILLKEIRVSTHTLLQKYEERRFDYVTDNPTTTNICSVLEAAFLHCSTQKSQSFFTIYSSQTVDQISFSVFLKCFVPKKLLLALERQKMPRTNVGRCRVWIRACLNEASLHSYLTLCTNELTKLSQLYAPGALIMDEDFLNQLISHVELLEELRFRLDLSSPLLNTWSTSNALQWLGLKPSPNTYDSPVSCTGTNLLGTDISDLSSSCSSTSSCALIESATREIFKEARVVSSMPCGEVPKNRGNLDGGFPLKIEPKQSETELLGAPSSSTSCMATTTSEQRKGQNKSNHCGPLLQRPKTRRIRKRNKVPSIKIFSERRASKQTHESLFRFTTQFPIGSNNLVAGSWRNLQRDLSAHTEMDSPESDYDPSALDVVDDRQEHPTTKGTTVAKNMKTAEIDCSWQVVGEDLLLVLTEQDMERLAKLYPGATSFDQENGRNCAFHGECNRCGRFLTPKTSFLDTYDAHLYCTNCHQLQETIIPRNVVLNWDFSLQSVSQTTKSFLSGLYYKPVLNLAKLNPTLYAVIPELLNVRQLRRAVILLWHQISRCDAKAASDLRRSLHPRDYMLFSLNDLDVYSMHDLFEVHSGRLERKITSVLCNVALAHVHGCLACRRRALLCDFCEDLRHPIWPHEVTTYRRCAVPGCHKVMHVACLVASVQNTDAPTSCFGCRPQSEVTSGRLNQFDTLVQRCRLCRTYSHMLTKHGVGHYADPFLPRLTVE